MSHKEKVPDDQWTLTGSGTADDPYRPDIFDDELAEGERYYYDEDADTVYEIVEDNQ